MAPRLATAAAAPVEMRASRCIGESLLACCWICAESGAQREKPKTEPVWATGGRSQSVKELAFLNYTPAPPLLFTTHVPYEQLRVCKRASGAEAY